MVFPAVQMVKVDGGGQIIPDDIERKNNENKYIVHSQNNVKTDGEMYLDHKHVCTEKQNFRNKPSMLSKQTSGFTPCYKCNMNSAESLNSYSHIPYFLKI